jgi:nucleotidyltransferase substrate binding protein (TIGR01987 family)
MKSELIRAVVRIILKHAKPERIYLYGSQADGTAKNTSDIDVAYDDRNFKDHFLIEEEVNQMQTLLKIDVTNIAFAEERFRNRIQSTGRVLYSAGKRLRAQDALHNFSRAFDKFNEAVESRVRLAEDGYENVVLDLLVKRFEFTFEMSWKAIKRYLDFIGIEAPNPRTAFKEAYAQGLIGEENVWLDMIEQRNISSHNYDESEISEILDKVETYRKAFETLNTDLKQRLQNA